MIRRTTKRFFALVLVVSICPVAFSQSDCYTDVPNVLDCEVDSLAKRIVDDPSQTVETIRDTLDGKISLLMFFAAADAFTDIKQLGASCSFQAYQHIGETARTDKQVGASAKSGGATSLVEKPGFARLLGFAIERGAIKQSVDNTTLTLSTTPYALIAAANRRDTAQLYQDHSFFNRFGVSASFNITDQQNVLGSASPQQLTEWSIKARLTGDRSNRGSAFRTFWNDHIRSRVGRPVALESKAQDLVTNSPHFMALENDKVGGFPRYLLSLATEIHNYLTASSNDQTDTKVLRVKQMILCTLKKNAYDPVKKDTDDHGVDGQYTTISLAVRTEIASKIVPLLAGTPAEVEVARKLLETYLKELEDKPESTLAYTNHRDPAGSDYSELKFLYRMKADALSLDANANISLYHNPNRALNQETIRDFTFSLALEGTASNPLNRGVDLSKITYTFSGSYERLKENEGMVDRKPDIASFQFKLEFPITAGLSIPIAYTYSNNTEMMMKKENKFNVGLHLDVDKLYEIVRGSR